MYFVLVSKMPLLFVCVCLFSVFFLYPPRRSGGAFVAGDRWKNRNVQRVDVTLAL